MFYSRIKKIRLILGLKNEITPVAEVEPVDIDESLVTCAMLPDTPYLLYYNEIVEIHKIKGIFPQIQSTHGIMPYKPESSGQNNQEPVDIQKLLEKNRWLTVQKDISA